MSADTPTKRPPGRPRRFDEATVMRTITDLFWSRGYEGVSMSDILDATGLHKGSLYRTFGDKPALYERALSLYGQEVVQAGASWLRSDTASPEDARARLAEFLAMPITARFDAGDGRGCFLCNASADETDGQPRIRDMIETDYETLETALRDLIARAYPGAGDTDREASAALVLSTYTGMRVRSRHVESRATLERVRDGALAAIDALLG